jgi:hypothetical protein
MARGIKSDVELVPLNSKVRPQLKQLVDALVAVKVNDCASVHDLITDMVKVYEEQHPQEFERARQLIALTAEKPDDPIAERR